MVSKVIMPKLGQTMEEGVIERWVKKEGDRVEKGDILLEITTDKATLEVESYAGGVLRKILAQEGETVPVTRVIGLIAELDEELPEVEVEVESPKQEPSAATPGAEELSPVKAVGKSRVKASPLARKLAQDRGIDLSKVMGTGPGGRITREDVLKAGEKGKEGGEGKVSPVGPMRRAIAEAMSASKRTVPHYYITIEVDMTGVVSRRREILAQIKDKGGIPPSYSHILTRALALALKDFPEVRSSWNEKGITVNEDINIGIAVGLDEGLIVPVLRKADEMTLEEIASQTESLVSRAKEMKLKADEYSGAIFTMSNLGMFGVENFLPIIDQPQSAILGVGAILERPAVVEGKVAIRHLMKLTLSVDHRVVDGQVAAQFLAKVKEILERGEW
ncbi:2-oxo acid dehydrogenase subunit E2 [candidate division NPL-UPA2 bacterium]|nr:2-oxo acid dehydrogenase subunit E2 [candidate division NPL-UPA2 bacterium]